MHDAWARVDDEIGREDERARRCGCRWKMGSGWAWMKRMREKGIRFEVWIEGR